MQADGCRTLESTLPTPNKKQKKKQKKTNKRAQKLADIMLTCTIVIMAWGKSEIIQHHANSLIKISQLP